MDIEVIKHQNILMLLPLPLILYKNSSSVKWKIPVYILIMIFQLIIIVQFKNPNCYQTNCPEIQNHREKQLFYEKYQTLDSDLGTLRTEEYQYSKIFKALNYQLSVFLLLVSFSQKGRFVDSLNYTLSIIFIALTFQITTILQTDIVQSTFTLFEQVYIIKVIEIPVAMCIREVVGLFYVSDSEIIKNSIKKNENNKNREHAQRVATFLEEKPKPSILSQENTTYMIFTMSILLLFYSSKS